MVSLGLGLKPPRMAADVGDRDEAEVSPENFSEMRVTAVTGWWGSIKERLTGRGLGGSGDKEVWTSEDPLAGPVTHDQPGYVSYGIQMSQIPHIQFRRALASLSITPNPFRKASSPLQHPSPPLPHISHRTTQT